MVFNVLEILYTAYSTYHNLMQTYYMMSDVFSKISSSSHSLCPHSLFLFSILLSLSLSLSSFLSFSSSSMSLVVCSNHIHNTILSTVSKKSRLFQIEITTVKSVFFLILSWHWKSIIYRTWMKLRNDHYQTISRNHPISNHFRFKNALSADTIVWAFLIYCFAYNFAFAICGYCCILLLRMLLFDVPMILLL